MHGIIEGWLSEPSMMTSIYFPPCRRKDMKKGSYLLFIILLSSSISGCTGEVEKEEDMSGADLSYADMSDRDLSYVNLSGADMHRADLNNANLTGADLTDTDLSYADLSGTIWYGTICPDGTNSDDNGNTCENNL